MIGKKSPDGITCNGGMYVECSVCGFIGFVKNRAHISVYRDGIGTKDYCALCSTDSGKHLEKIELADPNWFEYETGFPVTLSIPCAKITAGVKQVSLDRLTAYVLREIPPNLVVVGPPE